MSLTRLTQNRWVAESPTLIDIGRPETPPSVDALRAIENAIAGCGATKVYWFWISVDGDPPHLGLAVLPNDNAVVEAIGSAVEPIWRSFSPGNPRLDILRLGDPNIDSFIVDCGEQLRSSRGHA